MKIVVLVLMLVSVDQWMAAYCSALYGGQGYVGAFTAGTCECRRVPVGM